MESLEQRFSELYLECAGKVEEYVRRRASDSQLAEDIAQEVFFVAWRKKTEFTGSANPMGWLIQTAKYKLLEEQRRLDVSQWAALEEWEEQCGRPEGGYELAEWKQILKGFLSPQELQIFQDYFLCGHSVKEIADYSGITECNLRIRLYRMKKRLRNLL